MSDVAGGPSSIDDSTQDAGSPDRKDKNSGNLQDEAKQDSGCPSDDEGGLIRVKYRDH